MFPLVPLTLVGSALMAGAVAINQQRSAHVSLMTSLSEQTACYPAQHATQVVQGDLGEHTVKANDVIGDLLAKSQTAVQKLQARLSFPPSSTQPSLVATLRTTVTAVDNRYQQFMHQHFDRLFGAARDQQMYELNAAGDQLVISPDEKEVNRNLAASALMTGIALTAAGHPVVIVTTCLPLAIYMSRYLFQRVWYSLFVEHKLKHPIIGLVNFLATWLGGFYFAGGLSFTLFFLSEKFVFITQDRSQRKIVNIFGQQPRTVWALIDGIEIELPFEQVEVGTTLVIGAGQMIPVDGVITAGHASIEQQRLTGEAQPVEKRVGDQVLAATMVLAGKIYIKVEKTGKETTAAQIGEILNTTDGYQMAVESKAIQMVNALLYPTLLGAGLAWVLRGLEGAAAITCCGFGYDIKMTEPIAMLNYLNLAAHKGILIKDGRSLELLHEIDTVIFDKTGTLTLDQPQVAQIHCCNGASAATLLAYAAALEDRQSHPIARAIVDAAQAQGLPLPAINDARYEVGYGLKAWIDGQLIRIGSDRFMALENIAVPAEVAALQTTAHHQGHSLVLVALDDQLAGVIELEPTIRPEAQAIIADLHKRGKQVYIISGDQEQPTRTLAERLGIDHYVANTLPADKAGHVERLQMEGRKVCFVGDGINDAIALKQAQVSISLRGATSVATDTAQIVLMDATLNQLPTLFEMVTQFDRTMKAVFAAATIPDLAIVGGIFLAKLGIIGAIAIYNTGLIAGVGVAMLPLLQHREMKA